MAISRKIIFEVLTQFGAGECGCSLAAVQYINFAPNVDDLRLGGLFYNVHTTFRAAWALGARAMQKKSHRNKISYSSVMQKCVVLSASEAAAPELSPHFSVFYSVHLPRR
jgi:hypothetical protein